MPDEASWGDNPLGALPAESHRQRLVSETLRARLFAGANEARLGRYRLTETLGTGGMGTVWGGFDDVLGRSVAIKQFHALDPAASDRVLAEARALGALSHPNVVAVYEVGRHGGQPFIAMERVRGHTLESWTGAQHDRHERLDVALQAARGLIAAHCAGIVHGDFKPANVIVGDDGRVRVLDFGLSRSHEDTLPGGSALDDESTSTAQMGPRQANVAGTPGYMAPELFFGMPPAPESDQYAFCLVAYELLHGRRPFDESDFRRLIAARRRGPPKRRPRQEVPARVHAALLRGLAPTPSHRWPSMLALADAMGRTKTRLTLPALLTVGALGAATWASASRLDPIAPSSCPAPAASLETWWQTAAPQARAGIVGTGAANATQTWSLVEPRATRYVERWTEARDRVCAPTTETPASSEEREAALACLQQRRVGFEALMGLFAAAGPDDVGYATRAIADLPDPTRCVHAQGLHALAPELQRVRSQLFRVDALRSAGRYAEAESLVQSLAADAHALGEPHLRAETLLRVGSVGRETGDNEAAAAALRDAYFVAARIERDDIAVSAAANLTFIVGARLSRPSEGLSWARQGEVALERLGEAAAPEQEVELLAAKGQALHVAGELDAAVEVLARALRVARTQLGDSHPSTAIAAHNLGRAYYRRGDYGASREQLEFALDISTKTLGANHPHLATTFDALGNVLGEQRAFTESLDAYGNALRIYRQSVGSEHPSFASPLNNMGGVLHELGRLPEARARYEEALEIYGNTVGKRHPKYATALSNIAGIMSAEGKHSSALDHYARALVIQEAALGPDHPAVAEILNNMGTALKRSGNHPAAIAHFRRALAIFSVVLAKGHPAVIGTRMNLGNTYLLAGSSTDALHYFELALEACLEGADDGCATPIWQRKAEVLLEAGNRAAAAAALLRGARAADNKAVAAQLRAAARSLEQD